MSSRTSLRERIESFSLASEEPEGFPDVVNLNVGETLLTTCLSTLTKEKDSKLAAMFSGRNFTVKDSNGRYFIDCDGRHFEYILNYLRFGKLPPETKALDVFLTAKYFGISSLQHALKRYKQVEIFRRMDEISNGPKSRDYQKLKEAAVKNLNVGHTGDDIVLCMSPRTHSCEFVHESFLHLVPCVEYMVVVNIHVDVEMTDELVWCLAEDLHTMGYGQYVYSSGSGMCSRCFHCNTRNFGIIVLSSHMFERRGFTEWKRL